MPLQELPPARGGRAWKQGQPVRVRGRRWSVVESEAFAECELLQLSGSEPGNWRKFLPLLTPYDKPYALPTSSRVRRVTYGRWLNAFRSIVSGATPFGRLRALAKARADLHAYQLEPALAVLDGSATRLMLADEVGLGKTVQAATVLAELMAIGRGSRALVVTPAGLRDQWVGELRDRFQIEATVADAAAVRAAISRLAAGTNPWSTWPVIVTSLDFVKRPEVLRALDWFTWDLLVLDEAHGCATAPERSNAVRRLAGNSRRVVLCTATPHTGDDRAFARLCEIGALGDRLVIFRRTRADVGLPSNRRVHLLRVRCTDEERRMHRLLAGYTAAVWKSPSAGNEARLAMIVLRKRALSSAASLCRSLARRTEALFDEVPLALQPSLPFMDTGEQTLEDDEPTATLAGMGLEPTSEREWLERVTGAAKRAARCESKIARLLRLLARSHEPAIVFTEYRDTARSLAAAIESHWPVGVLHGGLSRRERQEVEHQFRTGAIRVLVATDAAGEGLNLHHRCRLVLNLELPWNPMRLEQRIGRVDRLGQRLRPHAINLLARATAEEQVVERLVVREERAQKHIRAAASAVSSRRPFSEEEVTAAVMDGARPDSRTRTVTRFESESVVAGNLRAIADSEVTRLEIVRSVQRSPQNHSAYVERLISLVSEVPRKRRSHIRGAYALCVFLSQVTDACGSVVDECVIPLRVDVARVPDARHPDELDAFLASLVSTQFHHDSRMAVVLRDFSRFCAASVQRERALAARNAVVAAEAVQPGMFDRRAVRAAEDENELRRSREQDRMARAISADSEASHLVELAPRLVLTLLVP